MADWKTFFWHPTHTRESATDAVQLGVFAAVLVVFGNSIFLVFSPDKLWAAADTALFLVAAGTYALARTAEESP